MKEETHPINAAKERDNITFQRENHDETHHQDKYYRNISRWVSTMHPAKWDDIRNKWEVQMPLLQEICRKG